MAQNADSQIPTIFFDTKGGSYWLALCPGKYQNLDSRSVKMHLRRRLVKVDLPFTLKANKADDYDYGLKLGDNILALAQLERSLDYAGPLAGHRAGPFETTDGRRVLVTQDVVPVAAKRGSCDNLQTFLGELLGAEQLTYFLLWLKLARDSLIKGDFRAGQMMVLAGPSGCGKSLCQCLITEFLGGRMAKPNRYMIGETAFNSDLASAEHLVIADEQASVDIRSRRSFGARVKDLCVNVEMSVHAKGREAITLPTYRRLTLSVNHEPENLAILPPMDDSITDKIMLFLCTKAEVGADRLKTWATFTRELPALAYDLEQMKVPKSLRDDRYGVAAYHSPALLEIVQDISPETRLLQMIDQVIFTRRHAESWDKFKERTADGWTGTAIELERDLRASEFSFAVEKLLSFSSACGTYLARLQSKNPARFEQTKSRGRSVWTIKKQES